MMNDLSGAPDEDPPASPGDGLDVVRAYLRWQETGKFELPPKAQSHRATIESGAAIPPAPPYSALKPSLRTLKREVEDLRTAVQERIRGESTARRRPTDRPAVPLNEDRDRFVYERFEARDSLAAIRTAVNEHPEWERIESDGYVSKIVRRFAESHGLPVTSRRRSKRVMGKPDAVQ